MRWVLLILLIGTSAPVISGYSIKPFIPGSYADILEIRQNKPFVLVFWSLECLPCYKELAMLGKLEQPFDLVLVSTDNSATNENIQKVLTRFQLQDADAWIYNDAIPERLRYEVDTTWYGELPRSYLFNIQHQRQTISGLLSYKAIKDWLQKNSPANNHPFP